MRATQEDDRCAFAQSKALLNERFRNFEPRWRLPGIAAAVVHPGPGPGAIATEGGIKGPHDNFGSDDEEEEGEEPRHVITAKESGEGVWKVCSTLPRQDPQTAWIMFLDYRGKRQRW